MEKFYWIGLVLLAGAILPIQAGLNGKMGKVLESPEWAVLISFLVGTITMILYVIVMRLPINFQKINDVPKSTWIAGVLGAIYVTTVVLAFPRLGAALTFGLIVAGQLIISLVLDHFKILVSVQHPINLPRLLGVALIVAGVIIFRRY